MFKKFIIIFPFLIALLLYIAQEIRTSLFEFKIDHQIELALKNNKYDPKSLSATGNYIEILRDGTRFAEQ